MKLVLCFFILAANVSCTQCGNPIQAIFAPAQCRELNFSFKKTRLIPPPAAACGAVAQSRKISITCGPASGTLGLCTSVSTNSNYYFIFVPDNNGGTFLDSTAGQINNCAELWIAIGSGTPPSDIYGAYYSNSVNGDVLTCTDVGGCASTSGSCVSSWDPATQAPSSTTLSIPVSTQLLACGFIDSPIGGAGPGGAPPTVGSGVPSIIGSGSFQSLSVSGVLSFTSWVDY